MTPDIRIEVDTSPFDFEFDVKTLEYVEGHGYAQFILTDEEGRFVNLTLNDLDRLLAWHTYVRIGKEMPEEMNNNKKLKIERKGR